MSPYMAFDGNPVFWADPSGADAVYDWDEHENGNVGIYKDNKVVVSFADAMRQHGMNPDGSDMGGPTAVGGNVDGLELSSLLGYNQRGYFIRESIKGRYYTHEEVSDLINAEINHLLEAKDMMDVVAGILFGQAVKTKTIPVANPIIKDYINIKGVKVPITAIMSIFLKHESSRLSNATAQFFNASLIYMKSDSNAGIYYIQKHSAVMMVPFWESISNSIYDAGSGNHLGSVHRNSFY
jgi:hypothetical protein